MKEKIRSFFHSPAFQGREARADADRSVSPCETGDQTHEYSVRNPDSENPASTTQKAPVSAITSLVPEQLDLRLASAENPTVVMELDLDCNILHVSKSWETLVGTSISQILHKPLSNILIGNTDDDLHVFNKAVEQMIIDNASYKVKFVTATNLRDKEEEKEIGEFGDSEAQGEAEGKYGSMHTNEATFHSGGEGGESKGGSIESNGGSIEFNGGSIETRSLRSDSGSVGQLSNDGGVIELEAQGILILSPSTKLPTRSIWTIRPFVRIEMDLSIPPALVDLLGFGSEIFEGYLLSLQESGIIDEHSVPEPKSILCRICETNIPAWFMEKHSDFCLLEHKAEEDLQFYHDAISDQRDVVCHIYESLWYAQFDCGGPPTPGSSSSSVSSTSVSSMHDYKGLLLPTPTPEPAMPPRHMWASLKQTKKFPFGILQKLLDYCDEALVINPAERSEDGVFNFSPTTESAIETVVHWQSLETSDPAIRAMVEDSRALIMEKVNHLKHLISLLQYSDKIKQEVDELVLASVKTTVARIRERVQESTFLRSRATSFGRFSRPDLEPQSEGEREIGADSGRENAFYRRSCEGERGTEKGSISEVSSPSLLVSSPNSPNFDGVQSPRPSRAAAGFMDAPASLTPIDILNPTYPERTEGLLKLTGSLENLNLKRASSSSSPRRHLSPAPYVEKANLSTLQKNTVARTNSPSRRSSFDSDTPFSRENAPTGLTLPSLGASSFASNSSSGSTYNTPLSGPVSGPRNSMSSSKPPLSPLLVSQQSNPKPSSGGIKDYEIIKAISKGAFGSVFLARRRLTGDYVAIKCLKKRDMIAKNQVLNVRAERAVLMTQADSPFVTQLYSSFQTKDYLYLVMEYLNGGDCATLLKMLGTLGDKWTKRYIAEVIVGVNDLHKRSIIHRDLKPDNILIDAKGHMKLTDFGLSKIGVVGRHTYKHRKSSASEHGIELFRKNFGSTVQSPLVNTIDSPDLMPFSHKRTSSVTPFSLTPEKSGSDPVFAAKRRSRSHFMSTRSGSNSSGVESPNVNPTLHRTPSDSSFAMIDDEFSVNSPQEDENIHSFALYDPEHEGSSGIEKFCGTPDYLAPEIILGDGQGEYSDWWSIGCIFFEFLYGYPPFHAETPEKVFKNILAGDIDWPPLSEADDREYCSPEAKDLIKRLLTREVEDRLGFNGAEEIMKHPYFHDINWETLYDEVPDSFVPTLEGPESTDYFDLRGADVSQFPKDDSDEEAVSDRSMEKLDRLDNSNRTRSMDKSTDRCKEAEDYLSLPSTPVSAKRERRGSKLADASEFGSFHFRNLNVLEKANKDVINRLKSEHLGHRHSFSSSSSDSLGQSSMSKSRGSSVSSGKANLGSPFKRPVSPLLVNPGSPGKSVYRVRKSDESRPRNSVPSLSQRLLSKNASESIHSPPSSDNEDSTSALYRVRKRRESMMQSCTGRESPQVSEVVVDLDVLYCEPIAIVRHTVSKLLEKHGCIVLAVSDGDDLVRRATSQVKFDFIFTALRLTKVEAIDAVKLIKFTSGVNSETPIVAITGFAKEAQESGVFDGVLEKPVESSHIRSLLAKFRDSGYESE